MQKHDMHRHRHVDRTMHMCRRRHNLASYTQTYTVLWSERYRVRQTNTHTDRQTDGRADRHIYIYTPTQY